MGKLLSLFFVLFAADLALLIFLGGIIGGWNTIFLVMAGGLFGAWLFKFQGSRTLRAWQEALAQGRTPEEGVLGGVLMLLGALLFVTPGVISDVLGLLLLVPPLRRLCARLLQPRIMSWVAAHAVMPQEPTVRVVYSDGLQHNNEVEIVGRRMLTDDRDQRPGQVIDAEFEIKP